MRLTLQDVIVFVIIAAALIVIVSYANTPTPTDIFVSGMDFGERIIAHAKKG